MEFNVRQFKKYAARRKEDLIYEAKPIGSAIKMRRKELKMTLEEGSEGICSVSYLSKFRKQSNRM
jgi:HTH-type transcriptional regulator, quorum sensing regulator NprR